MTLDTVVLTAFHSDAFPDELSPWLDRYALPRTRSLPRGTDDYATDCFHDGSVGVLATGVGPTAAATTAASLLSSALVGENTLFLTAGIAGGPPTLDVGSVVVGEAVVDWDRKHRTDDGVDLLDYRPRDYVYDLDTDLSGRVRALAQDTVDAPVVPGTVVAGGEFWHGQARADEVVWLCDQYDAPPYRATVTEDAGTAHALGRHGLLDRYATVRVLANHDREAGPESWGEGVELAADRAAEVGRALVDAIRANPDRWAP